MEQFDIVVVGGGPAGATFARIAGENRKILLLDQNGRPKPCGGLLSPDAQKALARFEITLPKEILVDPQIFAVKTIDLATWKERHYQRMYINLDREKFDLWLRSILPPGVEQVCGRCCSIRRQGGGFLVGYSAGGSLHTVFAKQLVGADGAGSVVRSQCFGPLKTRRYVAIQQWFLAKDVAPRPFYSCIFDPETTDCCAWTIHKDEYLIYGGAFAPKSCRAQFERQKEKLRQYGFPFGEPVKTEACLVLRPKSPKSFCCGGDGVFLIGEAAGFISPSSLEGISSAINSAVALCESLGEPDPHRAYFQKTRSLRWKLLLKNIKCLGMYQPFFRSLVMASGITSIRLFGEGKAR